MGRSLFWDSIAGIFRFRRGNASFATYVTIISSIMYIIIIVILLCIFIYYSNINLLTSLIVALVGFPISLATTNVTLRRYPELRLLNAELRTPHIKMPYETTSLNDGEINKHLKEVGGVKVLNLSTSNIKIYFLKFDGYRQYPYVIVHDDIANLDAYSALEIHEARVRIYLKKSDQDILKDLLDGQRSIYIMDRPVPLERTFITENKIEAFSSITSDKRSLRPYKRLTLGFRIPINIDNVKEFDDGDYSKITFSLEVPVYYGLREFKYIGIGLAKLNNIMVIVLSEYTYGYISRLIILNHNHALDVINNEINKSMNNLKNMREVLQKISIN